MRHSAVGDLADHPLELVHRFGQAVENRTGETVALQQLQLLSGIRFYSLGQPEKVTVTSLTMTGSGLTVTKPGFTGHEHR
jgi:hypothetical protein